MPFHPPYHLLAVLLLAACGRTPQEPQGASPQDLDTLGQQASLLAESLYQAGERDSALAIADRLIGQGAPQAEVSAWIIKGRVAQDETRYDDALAAYNEALVLARSTGDGKGESRALNQLGIVHLQRGDHEAALRNALDNLRLKEQLNDTAGMARAHHNLAMMYYEQGDIAAAGQALGTSLAIKERLGDSLGISNSLSVLCMLAIDRGEYDMAIAHAERSLAIMERNFPQRDPVPEYINIGLAHDGAGRRTEAMRYYRKALRALEGHPDDVHRAVVLNNMGQLLMDEGRMREAGPYLHESLDLARAVGARMEEKAALTSLLRHQRSLGRYREALAVSEALMAVNDSLLSGESMRSMNQMRVQYGTERSQAENERLVQANELAEARLARQRLIIAAITGGGVLFVALALLLVRNWRRRMAARMKELEHQALRAQMDPHFLFNALSSIPGLYYEQGPARATDYVGHLGQLLRLILDSSAERLVPVQAEVDLIEHYFRVMEGRHPGRFTWRVRVDTGIDGQRTGMPPMLLQPLVENALLHGVLERTAGGHVEVHVAPAANGLHCRVSDNGPGMAAPQDLTGPGRPSGLRITQERIRLANRRRGAGLRLNTLNSAQGAAGTEVSFTVRTEDLWS